MPSGLPGQERQTYAAWRPVRGLHVGVIGSFSTLRHHPDDVLRGIFDVASLAVDAVLVVDLEARAPPLLFDHLVDAGRTIAWGGLGPSRQVDRDRDRRVLELQMRRLVLLVIGAREGQIREPVE